ncbi:MAG: hypothetical protein LBJ67_16415 [Planctomycetaceae bacterium]|jgi:exonuclease III|nr:hypothetical protein [Planctomycetaceae bacterium]
MKIIFWNINQREKERISPELEKANFLRELIRINSPDILFLAECSSDLMKKISQNFSMIFPSIQKESKIWGFQIKNDCQINLVDDNNERVVLYKVSSKVGHFLLVTLHLLDKRNYDDGGRLLFAQRVADKINRWETEWNHSNGTVLIGDFNMNPFDFDIQIKNNDVSDHYPIMLTLEEKQ